MALNFDKESEDSDVDIVASKVNIGENLVTVLYISVHSDRHCAHYIEQTTYFYL